LMSLPVLVGFAGVLVAAVATGLLAGRCVRQPRVGFIVWTAATLGLTIALAAQSMGFASGFGPATFRAVQLLALLLAPLWLAWGLVELAVGSDAARFGMRLVSVALSVVASVILATDPLTAQPFGKAWPLTGTHFQPVSRDALDDRARHSLRPERAAGKALGQQFLDIPKGQGEPGIEPNRVADDF